MYKEYFGLEELPFSIAPDPRYLYMSEQHREALAHLLYGINSDGGFVLLTGDIGTGKTTVCRCLLEQIPENCRIAFIINPKITVTELLATICDEFGIVYPEGNESVKVFVDLINDFLIDIHGGGSRAVLIIDEAQNLGADVLEQLRLLTNLETNERKLLQIIILGQPELKTMLARPELRQLDQRITARYHLGPLLKRDMAGYTAHRLKVAGVERRLFPPSATSSLYRLSGGIPRLINVLCDRALIGTYVQGANVVTRRTLSRAAREVFGKAPEKWPASSLLTGGLAAAAVVALLAAVFNHDLIRKMEGPRVAVTKPPAGTMPSPAAEPPVTLEAPAAVATIQEPLEDTGATLEWLLSQKGREGQEAAFRSLFEAWGATYHPGEETAACRQAEAMGLLCLSGQGSLEDLLRLNRPAILKFSDVEGQESYSTLTALHGQKATLTVAGETRVMPFIWFGEYIILWKPPPNFRGNTYPGEKSPVVMWLENSLNRLREGAYQARGRFVYDEGLVEEVRRFQDEEGLLVDGIVGPRTLIHFNTAIGSGIPTLAGNKVKN